MSASTPSPLPRVRRAFVDVAEGQVHYRTAGEQHADRPPLVMLHASPGSARTLERIVARLARHRWVIAPDTLGNGDSSAPLQPAPDIAYFADGHARALDALGVSCFDLYGTHTGANIACELALRFPERARALILDGVSLYGAQEQVEMLEHYVPTVTLDQRGTQFHVIWNFVRDAYLFWPWYKPDAAHRRAIGLPPADDLHDKAVEVMKAARTFHLSYRAALAYSKETQLPRLRLPTLLACSESDMLAAYLERVRALLPSAKTLTTRGYDSDALAEQTAAIFENFLSSVEQGG